MLLPLGLLTKAVVVCAFGQYDWSIDKVPMMTVRLVEFNSQLVTLFTIVFAAIITTLVRRYALWKAQKGAGVAELEQLHSSISLPKTLFLIWSLRSFTMTSVALVLLWTWFYLGSQVVSRELKFYDSASLFSLRIVYANASRPSVFELGMPSSTQLAMMNAKFLPSVINEASRDSTLATGRDYLGNLLIPTRSPHFLKFYPHEAAIDKNGWWKTDFAASQDWSSFLGLNIIAGYHTDKAMDPKNDCKNCDAVNNKVIGEATISTNFIQANCSFAELENNSTFPGILPYVNTVLNMTNATLPTIVISEWWNNNSTIVSTCNLTESQVEVQMECVAQGCRTKKEKITFGQPLSGSLFRNQTAVSVFLNNLILSGGVPSTDRASDAALIDNLSNSLDDNQFQFSFFGQWKR